MNLLQGIIDKLDEHYPNVKKETRIGKQGISPEGIRTPCFFIFIVETNLLRQLYDFFLTDNVINVVYISDDKDRYNLEEIKLDLLFILEQIQLKQIGVTATEVSGKIVDGDIVITARYKVLLEKEKDQNIMKHLDENITTKRQISSEDQSNDSYRKNLSKRVFRDSYTKGQRKVDQDLEDQRTAEANKKIKDRDIENLKRLEKHDGNKTSGC
ncbi:DUF6838 family protein [Peptoniphilus sp.]|uniref:phage tail terminator family protein n=1 Tax=Peptoniphilus sp. TaxID=1971214 RepID=UPI003995DAA9